MFEEEHKWFQNPLFFKFFNLSFTHGPSTLLSSSHQIIEKVESLVNTPLCDHSWKTLDSFLIKARVDLEVSD